MSDLTNRMPKYFTVANLRHPVYKSWYTAYMFQNIQPLFLDIPGQKKEESIPTNVSPKFASKLESLANKIVGMPNLTGKFNYCIFPKYTTMCLCILTHLIIDNCQSFSVSVKYG